MLLATLAALAAPTQGAQAAPDPEALVTAAEQLKQRLDATTDAIAAPRLSNSGAELVRTAFSQDLMRAMPSDLMLLSRSCIAIGGVITAYIAMTERVTAGRPNADAASEALAVQLQDELSLGTAVGNRCVQRAYRAAGEAIAALSPTDQAGIAPTLGEMRAGATQVINGSLGMVSLPSIRPANRILVLSAMLADPAAIAASFPAGERRNLRSLITDSAARGIPANRARLNQLAAAFAADECNLLCRLASAN